MKTRVLIILSKILKFTETKSYYCWRGDSALDWTIYLANINANVTLIHRRNEFRGALDSVEKVKDLKNKNKIRLITPAEITKIEGNEKLEKVTINNDGNIEVIDTEFLIPLFGLSQN